MSEGESPVPARAEAAPRAVQSLDHQERWRLTLFKWRYSLEAQGFSEHEVQYLLFHKWRLIRMKSVG